MNLGRLGRGTANSPAPSAILILILLGGGSLATLPRLSAATAQSENYQPDSLFIALLSGGDSLVEYDIKLTNLHQDAAVTLFGDQDFRDLIVADFNDKLIAYDSGPAKNQILLRSPDVSDVRISYSTQDLLNKTGKVWSFSVNSPVTFTVKLPANSVLMDAAGTNPPAIKTLGGQYLLTFDPGPSNLNYIIGVVGTENQATIVVKAAETTIREIKAQYPNIVLDQAETMLKNASAFLTAGRFSDAESLAGKANDAAVSAGQDYSDAQSAISLAEQQIANATGQGRDVSSAISIIQQAKNHFSRGDYAGAKDLAEQSTGAIGVVASGGNNSGSSSGTNLPLVAAIIGTVAAAGGGGGLVFLRMRSRSISQPTRLVQELRPVEKPAESNNVAADAIDSNQEGLARTDMSASDHNSSQTLPDVEIVENKLSEPPSKVPSPPLEARTLEDSQTSPGVLSRIVGRIFEEKPSLRQEDRDVLSFLAEKEGAAFESEIRGKFQLPKTTIWRLVKRLEREDLVEIRKAGGQNLIKLRFEGRQP